jgi:hypothetical protein
MIEMHNGSSQVVMKGTTLSMVHRERNGDEKRREAKVEPRSCKETTTKTRKENHKKRQEKERQEKERQKEEKETHPQQSSSSSAYLTWRLKVLMLSQKGFRICLEFLIGKASTCVQLN